jgi:hypothetical protein
MKEKYKITDGVKSIVLLGDNGFSRRMKANPKDKLVLQINIPFVYKVKIQDPTVGFDYNFEITPEGTFYFERRTKTQAFYRLQAFKYNK